jgi:cell division protein FtsW (lipid II flippase)
VIGLFIALPMVLLGQALPHNVPFRWWLAITLIALCAASSVQMFRDSARAERFLQHTKPTSPV